MAVDFRGIFRISHLRTWWDRVRLRAARVQLEQISQIVNKQEKQKATTPTGNEKHDQALVEEWQRKNQESLFEIVGRALSLWAQMEESLVIIAGILLRTKFTKTGAIFYSILNFHVWLSLIDELFALEPGYESVRPKWNKLAERLKKLNDTRVRLAHHTIHATRSSDPLEDSVLRPGRLDSRRKSQRNQPLDFGQILTFVHSVADVLTGLTEIVTTMGEIVDQEPLPQKSSEQGSGQNPP